MAEVIPPPLKIPEISRFLNRANQARSFKPAIAYWCEYHAVNQIVGKSLHTADDDCFNFTKMLLERLESTKAERPDDDAIMDNTAGQAYVEQFAQETFDRAERTMRANKVTRQTADTFDAAATFFDLTHEWGAPEPETLQKIKFAKWNAARILKAIREGKDPNESNPRPLVEEEQQQFAEQPTLDPLDPAVLEITGASAPPPQSAYVEDAADMGEPGPSRPDPSQPSPVVGFPPSPPPAHDGYFPPQPLASNEPYVPSPLSSSPAQPVSGLSPPPVQPSPPSQGPIAPVPQQPTAQVPPQFQFTPNVTPQPPPQPLPPPAPAAHPSVPPVWTAPPQNLSPAVATPPPPPVPLPQQATAPVPAPALRLGRPTAGGSSGLPKPDQKSINQAQKHAKFAISALNFDDIPTAVQELRNALATLGAS